MDLNKCFPFCSNDEGQKIRLPSSETSVSLLLANGNFSIEVVSALLMKITLTIYFL
jgi:hypothetical protein